MGNDPRRCSHGAHTPRGICLGCGEQHEPLPGYTAEELEQREGEFWAEDAAAVAYRHGARPPVTTPTESSIVHDNWFDSSDKSIVPDEADLEQLRADDDGRVLPRSDIVPDDDLDEIWHGNRRFVPADRIVPDDDDEGLVTELRELAECCGGEAGELYDEAADRILALTRTLADAEQRADKAERHEKHLNDEVDRWINAYRIAYDQAMANGQKASTLGATLAEVERDRAGLRGKCRALEQSLADERKQGDMMRELVRIVLDQMAEDETVDTADWQEMLRASLSKPLSDGE